MKYLRFLLKPHGDADTKARHIEHVASTLLTTATLAALLIAAAIYAIQ